MTVSMLVVYCVVAVPVNDDADDDDYSVEKNGFFFVLHRHRDGNDDGKIFVHKR